MSDILHIIGHKNPDTDSIVSSIAYAEYKRQKGYKAQACRIGPANQETEYLLDRFGFEEPLHIFTAKCNIEEIDYDKAVLVDKNITIKDAFSKMNKSATRTIFVTNKKKQLEGVVSLSNLNNLWMTNETKLEKILSQATFDNIVKVLKAEVVNRADNFKINGNVDLTPIEDIEISENDIVITASEKKFLHAIKSNAGLIIVVGKFDMLDKYADKINKANTNIIKTQLTPLKISRLLYQAPSIENVMVTKDKVICAYANESVDDCLAKISKTRFRMYPIVDDNNVVIGSLSRYHLINYKKKKYILVDHNEVKQSIEDLSSGEVVEIIDHHRVGGFINANPITITTMAVGATASIIAHKFISEGMELSSNLAGLLLGAILSDTMNFKSPTYTEFDKETAKKLIEISNVDSDELYTEIIKNQESLLSKRIIDIIYDDYKEYDISNIKVGISQVICKDRNEFFSIEQTLRQALDENCITKGLDLMLCMFTLSNGYGSYVVVSGDKKEIIHSVFPNMKEHNFVNKLVSRKKQLLPNLIKELS